MSIRRWFASGIEGFIRSRPNVATGVVTGIVFTAVLVCGVVVGFR